MLWEYKTSRNVVSFAAIENLAHIFKILCIHLRPKTNKFKYKILYFY